MEFSDMMLGLLVAGSGLIGYCLGVHVVHRQAVKRHLAYWSLYKKGWSFTWRSELPGTLLNLQEAHDRSNDVLECYKRRYDACQESLAVAECAVRAAEHAREVKKARLAALAEQLRAVQMDEEPECPQD